jgi:2-polyprenyl-3-methyl-5-hydroxy-6-metoxy-1,4-benzoquinol methylase
MLPWVLPQGKLLGLGEQVKTFQEYMNDSRAPRSPEERAETEGLSKVFDRIGIEGDDLIRERARKHPTFLLRCHWENHAEFNALERFPEIQGKVLDFGCGSGHLTVMAAEKGYDIDGVDELDSAIQVAEHVASQSFAKRKPVFWEADVEYFIVTCMYDSIWASHVFEHIEHPERVLKALKNWINPKGYILIATPLGDNFPDPSHVHKWHDTKSFEDFFAPWLSCVRSEADLDTGCLRGLFQFK